jgi:hypothetical protein
LNATLDSGGVNINSQEYRTVKSSRERLSATHSSHTAGHHEFAAQVSAEMSVGHCRKCFKGALNDSLCADINPTAGGHLAVHHQALTFQLVEVFPVGPGAYQIRVGDQNARRIFVSAKHADRLAGLDQQGLIVLELLQFANDCVKRAPVACSFSRAAVNNQIFRTFRYVRIEIVHEAA